MIITLIITDRRHVNNNARIRKYESLFIPNDAKPLPNLGSRNSLNQLLNCNESSQFHIYKKSMENI